MKFSYIGPACSGFDMRHLLVEAVTGSGSPRGPRPKAQLLAKSIIATAAGPAPLWAWLRSPLRGFALGAALVHPGGM